MREETRCSHMGYSFQLAAMVLLYAPSHRQDSTYHSLCYTSRGALAGTTSRIRSEINSYQRTTNALFFSVSIIKITNDRNVLSASSQQSRQSISHKAILMAPGLLRCLPSHLEACSYLETSFLTKKKAL